MDDFQRKCMLDDRALELNNWEQALLKREDEILVREHDLNERQQVLALNEEQWLRSQVTLVRPPSHEFGQEASAVDEGNVPFERGTYIRLDLSSEDDEGAEKNNIENVDPGEELEGAMGGEEPNETIATQNVQQNEPPAKPSAEHRPTIECFFCHGPHPMSCCIKFKVKPTAEKWYIIDQMGRCENCFGNHAVENCPKGPCRRCNQKHNSMLCFKSHN